MQQNDGNERHEYLGNDEAVSHGVRWGCGLLAAVLIYFLIRLVPKIDRTGWLGLGMAFFFFVA